MAQKKPYNYKLKSDAWYDWKGVKPPERVPNMTEEEMAEMFANNLKGHKCEWVQNGNAIECQAGTYVHGKRIGTSVRLAGTSPEGEAILVPIGPIYRDEV